MGNSESSEKIPSVKEIIERDWIHKKAKKLALSTIDKFGIPSGISRHSVTWEIENKKPYIEITVRDEPKNYARTVIFSSGNTSVEAVHSKKCSIVQLDNKLFIVSNSFSTNDRFVPSEQI